MLGNNRFRKLITSFTAVAVLCVYSMVVLAVPAASSAEITIVGQVSVNGQSAVSNATIVSGSSIVAGPGSSAIINLGRTGRIEILENTTLTLTFSDNSIVGILSSGRAKVANPAGVAATVATKNATVIADAGQADNFLVEAECSHTHVDTTSGMVTLREGTTDKQVGAGTSAVAGDLAQTGCPPCLRPNSAPPVAVAGWPWLILLAAGAAGVAILLGSDTETETDGGIIVVSPTR
jgi:hypothetical protein